MSLDNFNIFVERQKLNASSDQHPLNSSTLLTTINNNNNNNNMNLLDQEDL